MSWDSAQKWETEWWGDCANTYGEEEKQLLYADRMGLKFFHNGKSPYNIDLDGKSVLDIGGGPSSLLLKCVNVGILVVNDPLPVPDWVINRYASANIRVWRDPSEELKSGWSSFEPFDEVWIYNVLQHTKDPAEIVNRARKASKLIRIFEWVDTPTNIGHPHSLSEDRLNEWLGGHGKVEQLTGQAGCFGKCYYGIFPTEVS